MFLRRCRAVSNLARQSETRQIIALVNFDSKVFFENPKLIVLLKIKYIVLIINKSCNIFCHILYLQPDATSLVSPFFSVEIRISNSQLNILIKWILLW